MSDLYDDLSGTQNSSLPDTSLTAAYSSLLTKYFSHILEAQLHSTIVLLILYSCERYTN